MGKILPLKILGKDEHFQQGKKNPLFELVVVALVSTFTVTSKKKAIADAIETLSVLLGTKSREVASGSGLQMVNLLILWLKLSDQKNPRQSNPSGS